MNMIALQRLVKPLIKAILCLLVVGLLLQAAGPGYASLNEAAEVPWRVNEQADAWLPGLYTGWVYFLARSDMDYHRSEQDVQMDFAATLFYESHGTIDCSVADTAGNGNCSTNFPLDMNGTEFGTASMPECTITVKESFQAQGIANTPPLAALLNVPLGEGFSLPFNPKSGPAEGRMQVTAAGSGAGCESKNLQGEFPVGIKWDDLDFYVEDHTPLVVGGTCSMASFPREMTINAMHTTAVIEECRWRMFFFDPYAKLPER